MESDEGEYQPAKPSVIDIDLVMGIMDKLSV